jgi:hypothetical protein
MKGSKKNVWYILTDVDDLNVAAELGLNFSAKLTFASNASRTATLAADGTLVFDKGTVDFSPVRRIVPGLREPSSLRSLPNPERWVMQITVLSCRS